MEKYTDYFHLLDVDQDTSKEGIKKAFMSKALLFHPDKAKTAGEKKSFTKIYEDLQNAYRILTNENSRRQYLDANRKTNLDLKLEARDVSYHALKTVEKIESTLFNEPVKQRDIESYILKLEQDTRNIKDYIDTTEHKTVALEIYQNPFGLELAEYAPISLEGLPKEGKPMAHLITGNDITGTGEFKFDSPLSDFQTGLKKIQAERDMPFNGDYIIEPSEIEKAYGELFAPSSIEGLGRR
jgi:curved DNA-binding protein CbpA